MPDPLAAIATSDYATLAAEAQGLRERLNRLRLALGRHFVARQAVVDALVVGAIAQEPVLLVGPPGTAKSALVTALRDALAIGADHYFEYTLTRFTEPAEILGPVDIQQLRQGAYRRRVAGKLPTATMAFLDEVFKSNSAILNALLTVINEGKFYQDGRPEPVALRVLMAASNDIPADGELAALRDRFALKVPCPPVQDDHFTALLDMGLAAHTQRALNQRPWAEGHATLEDILKAHRYLTLQFAAGGPEGGDRDRQRFFPEPLLQEFRRVIKTLAREQRIAISDRRVVSYYRLVRTRAWLFHGGRVERQDLELLAYAGDSGEELTRLATWVPRLLGLA